jgi:hypothetical protein
MPPGARSVCILLALALVAAQARAEPPPTTAAPVATGTTEVPLAPVPRVTPRLAREAVAAALRAAGSPATRERLSSMAARSRTSAVLPELVVRAARSTDDSLRLSPTVDNPYAYSALGGAGLFLEARMIWRLDRLLFDREEVAVERLRREHAEAMSKVAARVLDVLFAWQRAVVRAEDAKVGAEELEQATLARAEAEATLDFLTAGWFMAATGAGAAPTRH